MVNTRAYRRYSEQGAEGSREEPPGAVQRAGLRRVPGAGGTAAVAAWDETDALTRRAAETRPARGATGRECVFLTGRPTKFSKYFPRSRSVPGSTSACPVAAWGRPVGRVVRGCMRAQHVSALRERVVSVAEFCVSLTLFPVLVAAKGGGACGSPGGPLFRGERATPRHVLVLHLHCGCEALRCAGSAEVHLLAHGRWALGSLLWRFGACTRSSLLMGE